MNSYLSALRTLAVAAVILPIAAVAAVKRADDATRIVIEHARVFSPPNTVLDDATIVVEGDRIAYVGKKDFTKAAGRHIDARGKTVIPGLIDVHTHILMGADSDASYEKMLKEAAPGIFKDYLAHGITTVLSAGDYWPQITRVKAMVESAEIPGPRLLIAGPIITAPNSHPFDHCSKNKYMCEHWTVTVETEAQARKVVQELAAARIDIMKIIYDGRTRMPPLTPPIGHMSADVLRTLIDEAHRHGLRVGVHANPVENAIEALEAGADFLQHGPGIVRMTGDAADMSTAPIDDFMAAVKKRNAPVATTMAGVTSMNDLWGVPRLVAYGGKIEDFSAADQELLAVFRRLSLADTRLFVDRGLTLALGTDLWEVKSPGAAYELEIGGLTQAGLTPAEILTIATLNGAKAIGREKDLGSIEVGKLADLVVVAGDPLKHVDFLGRIDLVIKAGEVVHDYAK